MRASYELWIALRYLRARGREAFISLTTWLGMGGVTVGVAALVIVVSVMGGFEAALRDRILSANPHVLIYSLAGAISEYEPILRAAEETPGVSRATPYAMGQIMTLAGGKSQAAVIRSIDPVRVGPAKDLDRLVTEGTLDELSGTRPNIAIGKELARALGIGVGGVLQAVTPTSGGSPFGFSPRTRTFRVSAIFSSGLYDYDSTFVFTSLESAQDFLGLGDRVNGVQVYVAEAFRAREVARAIQRRLGPGYWARSWIETNRNLFAALKLQKAAMAVILALIVLVAAFNVASGLIMAVLEKTSQIGVLKSMGATNRSIRRIFLFQGFLVGFFGAVMGLFLGGAVCWFLRRFPFIKIPGDVYFIDTLPVAAKPEIFALVALGSIALCLFAAVYPSWKASRLDPAQILRNE